jgi:pyruvate formate lyase activating enzyme
VRRDWYDVSAYRINEAQRCVDCGTHIAGRFGTFARPFGRKRIPVTLQ